MKNSALLFEIGTWIQHDIIFIVNFFQSNMLMQTGDVKDLMKIKNCAIFHQFHFHICQTFANNLHFIVTTCARFFTLNYTREVSQLNTA